MWCEFVPLLNAGQTIEHLKENILKITNMHTVKMSNTRTKKPLMIYVNINIGK